MPDVTHLNNGDLMRRTQAYRKSIGLSSVAVPDALVTLEREASALRVALAAAKTPTEKASAEAALALLEQRIITARRGLPAKTL